MILIDGKKLKQKVMKELLGEMNVLKQQSLTPHLVVIQVGEDETSNIYVSHKKRVARKLGIKFSWIKLDSLISFDELKEKVNILNDDDSVTGIIIQFPLPDGFSKSKVASLVIPSKDADGINPLNQETIKNNIDMYAPITCTPKGVMRMLEEYNINLESKKAVVLGRSIIVGKPMKSLLNNAGSKVEVINRDTSEEVKKELLKGADVIISATGHKDIFSPEDVKDGVVIIDVGIIRDDKILRGDLKYQAFENKASYITPVPGGVGPMTVMMLMSNVIELMKERV